MKRKKIAIVCGEMSGDLYAGLLAENVRKAVPDIELVGLGGPLLGASGVRLLAHYPGHGEFGFTGVALRLAAYRRFVGKAGLLLEQEKPDLAVFIDNPGCNFALASRLRGIPAVWYIPPKVWAHGYGRIFSIKKHFRAVVAIFPFEPDIYRKEGIEVAWFGHPVLDLVGRQRPAVDFFTETGLDPSRPVVALFPGSRVSEVKYILPLLLESADFLASRDADIQFCVSVASSSLEKAVRAGLGPFHGDMSLWRQSPYDLAEHSRFALCASGTLNLELALLGCPMMVYYRMDRISFAVTRRIVRIPFASPVNILAGKEIVAEHIQNIDREKLGKDLACLADNPGELDRQKQEFAAIRERLYAGGEKSVSENVAAWIVKRFLNQG